MNGMNLHLHKLLFFLALMALQGRSIYTSLDADCYPSRNRTN